MTCWATTPKPLLGEKVMVRKNNSRIKLQKKIVEKNNSSFTNCPLKNNLRLMMIKLLNKIINIGQRPIGLKWTISTKRVKNKIRGRGELCGSLKCQAIIKQNRKSGLGKVLGMKLTGASGSTAKVKPIRKNWVNLKKDNEFNYMLPIIFVILS